jgi:hypothetical protein
MGGILLQPYCAIERRPSYSNFLLNLNLTTVCVHGNLLPYRHSNISKPTSQDSVGL